MVLPCRFAFVCICVFGIGGVQSDCSIDGSCHEPVGEESALLQLRHASAQALACEPNSNCTVPKGETRILSTSIDVNTLKVYGVLQWDTSKDGLEIKTKNLLVQGVTAKLEIGTWHEPMLKKATIYIKANNETYAPDFGGFGADTPINICGQRGICGAEGSQIGIHGRQMNKTWSLLKKNGGAGDTFITLKDDAGAIGWREGDQIAIATTSRGKSWLGSIKSIAGPRVELSKPLEEKHLGGSVHYHDHDFEMAAEVLNLERSVVITGDHENFHQAPYQDSLHVIQSFTGVMQVSYTRVEYCGRRDIGGQYCLHWHVLGQCPTCYFTGNAIYESNQIGLAVHGVHGTTTNWNTLWNSRAVGIYTEDGNEMNNNIEDNAVVCATTADCDVGWREFFGRAGAGRGGIYLIGVNNNVRRNRVAAHANGAWYNAAERGLGSTGNPGVTGRACPRFFSIGEIVGNVYHDNAVFGTNLDQQYPREVDLDPVNGLLPGRTAADLASCEPYKSDGSDNGAQPANKIVDQFDYNNQFTGMQIGGDIQWIRLTSVDNDNGMYWLQSKNFADGSLYHIEDSIFVGLPSGAGGRADFGGMKLLLPGGPFTFGMNNVTIVGKSDTHGGALQLNNGCGQAGSPCTTQYLLNNVVFNLDQSDAPRVGLFPYPVQHAEAAVGPILISKDGDNSLDGHRSIVSWLLNGFGKVDGCTQLGKEWRNSYGCSVPVRRLNVWPLRDVRNSLLAGHTADLELSGPGYDVPANASFPTNSQNAGHMKFSLPGEGFSLPVVAGQHYTLNVTSQVGAPAYEFSDRNLNAALGDDETLTLSVVGGTAPLNCTLKGSAQRPWLSFQGPGPAADKGFDEGKIKAGCLS